MLDRSVGFEEGATYQTLRAMQLCRYFDTQVFYKDEDALAQKRPQKGLEEASRSIETYRNQGNTCRNTIEIHGNTM